MEFLEPVSAPASPAPQAQQKEESSEVRKSNNASGLVSYFDDAIDDDAVDDYQSDSVSEKDDESRSKAVTSGEDDSKSPEVVAVKDMEEDDTMIVEEIDNRKVKLPPEPTGQVRPELQERVAALYAKKVKTGLNMNYYIQQNKLFRNPSIYEKLIMLCNIDELGTNYPAVSIYDFESRSRDSIHYFHGRFLFNAGCIQSS